MEGEGQETRDRSGEFDQISMRLGYKKMMCNCGKSLSSFTTIENTGPFICSTTCLLWHGTGLPIKIESKQQKQWIDFLVLGNQGKDMILEIPNNCHDHEIPIVRVHVKQDPQEAFHQAQPAGPINPGRNNLFHAGLNNASAFNAGRIQNSPVLIPYDYAPIHPQQNYHPQRVISHDGQYYGNNVTEGRNLDGMQMYMRTVPSTYNSGNPTNVQPTPLDILPLRIRHGSPHRIPEKKLNNFSEQGAAQ